MSEDDDDSAAATAHRGGGGITFHNGLHPSHRHRAALEEALTASLADLTGSWDISVNLVGRAWLRIDVVAPDGASWWTTIPAQQGARPEEIAETVRVACIRRDRLHRPNSRRSAPEGTSK